jgi:hypothetical protein
VWLLRFIPSRDLFLFFIFLTIFAFHSTPGRAQAALLIEQPYGFFGTVNPTGHNAIFFEHICAETPVKLRRCAPGELGAVLSRYQGIGEYDWVAIPLIPYLYSVEDASAVPTQVNPLAVNRMRNHYHEAHLLGLGEDLPEGNLIHGGWTQLIGAAYERRIYAFRFQTTEAQDDALIARLNAVPNLSHFSLLFNNCGDFARKILNTYFPRAFRRSIFPDAGLTTPKQVAFKLAQYARKHPETELTVYEIPQIPGYRRQSRTNKNINESLMTTLYAVPIALINPYLAGGLFVDYFARGRSRILPNHPQLLTPDDLKSWAQPALTASTPTAQNPGSAGAQAPVAADTGSAEMPETGGTNSGLREIEATFE